MYESIPENARTVVLRRKLSVVYENIGDRQAAVKLYEQILREQPLALEVIIKLLAFGKGDRDMINKLMKIYPAWIKKYLQGVEAMYACNFKESISHLTLLNSQFTENPHILCRIAVSQSKRGLANEAMHSFADVRRVDPEFMDYMEDYANLLSLNGKEEDLNRLALDLVRINDKRPEPWLAMGRFHLNRGDRDQALAYADRAWQLDKHHIQTYQLRGLIHLSMDRFVEAIQEFRHAHRIMPDLITYQGLMESYLGLKRLKEALSIAQEASMVLPRNPQSLTLANKLFQRALTLDPKCVEALFAMITILNRDQKWAEAIKLMEANLKYHNAPVYHTRLAELYAVTQDYYRAIEHFNAALSLNPDCYSARDGIARVEALIGGVNNEPGGDDQ
ncbi:Anaphase-promoting complex subunit 7 [Blyttiomyces sp. JEL0837]|nr:Anaphase-promoting complex subunit 7 [Blyttiomyces sp. JEL0837]